MAACLRNACLGLFVLLLPCCVLAGRDNQGKEFILGFMENKVFHDTANSDIELFVTTASDNPVTVTVTTPLYDPIFKLQEVIVKGSTTMFTVPYGIRGVGNEKSNKGVLIQATEEVTVYSVNKEVKSTDAYISLPVDVLGTEYYAMTYHEDPEVLVVATEDDTLVNISCPVSDQVCSITFDGETYSYGKVFTVKLDRFETFHATQSKPLADYTGVHVTSDKPVTVISGNKKVKVVDVSYEKSSKDHLTEQMMPVSTWGTQFNTPSTPNRLIGDFFRVVASQDDTSVTLYNGTSYLINKAGHFVQFNLPSGEYQTLSASAPVLVAMFSKTWQGSTKDGEFYGDPALSLVIPEPQYASDYTWSTVREATGKEFHSTVLVIVDKAKVPGLRLDDKRVQWKEEKEILGNPKKVHVWVNVTDGSHTLYHVDPTVTFMAMVSGVFLHNSYSYLAGLRLAEINTVCVPTFNTTMQMADIVDNDCDNKIDEDLLDGIDNDGDGLIDEDVPQYPTTIHTCQITGDPHLTQFGGRRASIPFPCQYQVAFLRFNDYDQAGKPTFNQSVIEVNISASNGLTPVRGQYYVDVVSVIVTIISPDGVQTPVGNFTTWSKLIRLSAVSSTVTPLPGLGWETEWATDSSHHRGRIQMSESPEEELAELTISGISLRVQFRPYNDKKLSPGVTVEVAGDVIPDDRALYPATMCSTVGDRKSPVLRAWGASVTAKDVGLYAAVKQTLTQTIGEGQKLCSSVIDVYRDCVTDQNLALGNCSKALADPAVLSCATSEEKNPDNMLRDEAGFDLFRDCLGVFCAPMSRMLACERLYAYDEACPGKWPEINEVICPRAVQ